MNVMPLVSLCIPTNGISEWVCPVLESIYTQCVDEELFEVVITDNGNNQEFKNAIDKYLSAHRNICYQKTDAYMFQNQIEAFKLAKGEFIKFVNHRMTLNDGALQHIIEFVKENHETKPTVYFSNGVLQTEVTGQQCDCFEKFVERLSYWSSWSAGLAMWKEDFNKIPENQEYNLYFPHITILFYEREKTKYIIDNTSLMHEILIDDTKKGRYNLFRVFAVEYVSVVGDLLRRGSISIVTFLTIKKDVLRFLSELYWKHVLRKKKCSYILDDYKSYLKVYYSMSAIRFDLLKMMAGKIWKKNLGR